MPTRVALLLGLLPLVLTGRAVFTGDVYGPIDLSYTSEPLASIAHELDVPPVRNPALSDVYTEFIPWNDAVRRSIGRGEWPLWNPYELSGTPLAGAAQAAPYHPITVAGLLLPLPASLGFAAAMLYLIAAVSAWILARDLGVDELPALFAAAAWMASTHIVFFAGTALGNAASVLPLILAGARRIVREPGRRSMAVLTGALVLLVLSGHPETALHTVALAVVWFAVDFTRERPQHWVRVVTAGLGSGILALLLTAFFLLPHLYVIRQSEELFHRLHGYEQKISSPAQMAHRLGAMFFPFIEGSPGLEERHHPKEIAHGWMATAYTGTLVLPLALVGLIRSRRGDRWLLAGTVVCGLGAGIAAPGFVHVFNRLPGFDIAVNDRMAMFAALGLAMLAALGLETIAHKRVILVALAVMLALVVVAAVTAPADLEHSYVLAGAVRAGLPLLLAGVAVVALRPDLASAALLALLLIQRGGETAHLQPTIPASAFYPPFPGLELMRSTAPFRFVATGTIMPPALSTHYGIEDVRGFQAVTLGRYAGTYPLWCVRQPVWSNRVDDLSPPFLSLMNVRFGLVPHGAAIPEWWVRRGEFPNYDVVENTRALPRAFIPASVHRVEYSDEALRLIGTTADFGAESVIESGGERGVFPNGPGTITLQGGGSRLRLRTSMTAPGWVVVSNAAWQGWRARTSAGEVLPIRFANYAFIAIKVPAGDQEIDLYYLPQAFVTGGLISAGAAGLVALLSSGIFISAITFFMSFRRPSSPGRSSPESRCTGG